MSDIGMKNAYDKRGVKTSADFVFENKHLGLKLDDYYCIGCRDLPIEIKTKNTHTVLRHTNDNLFGNHYFRRKNKEEYHDENCCYRNPISFIQSMLTKHEINFDEFRILVGIINAAKKTIEKKDQTYMLTSYAKATYFTNINNRKFINFLRELIQDIDFNSIRNKVSRFYIQTEDGDRLTLSELIYSADELITQLDMIKDSMIVVVYGKIGKVIKDENARIFFEIKNKLKTFKLFVAGRYLPYVGDLSKLSGRTIACYGIAKKTKYDNNTYYQMDLYSIKHQIVTLDNNKDTNFHLFDETKFIENFKSEIEESWKGKELSENDRTEIQGLFYKNWVDKWHSERGNRKLIIDRYEKISKEHQELLLEKEKLFRSIHILEKEQKSSKNELGKMSYIKRLFNSKKVEELESLLNTKSKNILLFENRMLNVLKGISKLNNEENMSRNEYEKIMNIENTYQENSNLMDWEIQCKKILLNEDNLFSIPFTSNTFKLIIAVGIAIKNNNLHLYTYIQLYKYYNELLVPIFNKSQIAKQEIYIPLDNEIYPLVNVYKFMNILTQEIKNAIVLAGWPESQTKCPVCKGNTRLRYYKNLLHFKCWNQYCHGEVPIKI